MTSRTIRWSLALALLTWMAGTVSAQYILPYDTLGQAEDSAEADADTAVPDTIELTEDELPLDTNYVRPAAPPPAAAAESHLAELNNANTWVRRLLFRGWLDTSHIGAFARYQLTAWNRSVGSYGPIEARVTVYYLGPVEWMGKDAEWLQVAVQSMNDEPVLIEYDVLVPSQKRIKEVYRILYRMDHGEVRTTSLVLPENVLDYDQLDEPVLEGMEDLEFYSGIFETEVFRGAGNNGSDVYIYRADKMPPLGIVALGYGDEGLTFTSSGSDASPRFYVPAPLTGR